MKKTKIDWCDASNNCVYGCPNDCKYCYGNVMNKRFHFCKDWKVPEWKPEHLKDFYSKKPKSIFIDSMSDIGTWQQEWFNAVMKTIAENPQHNCIALTKRLAGYDKLIAKYEENPDFSYGHIWIGTSITKQADLEAIRGMLPPDFYSVEPILEPIDINPCFEYKESKHYKPTFIIGAETGNRKGKVIPQKEWITSLVKQADEHNCIVFMKESLRKIMGKDFRQDELPWEIAQ